MWRLSLEQADAMGTTERSSRHNAVVGGSLYLVGTPSLTLTAAAAGPGSGAETDCAEWEAAILIWWDDPPCDGPR